MTQVQQSINLWKELALAPGASRHQIDQAYFSLRKEDREENKNIRLAWKILRDPYYQSTYNHYQSVDIVKSAGFIDDGLPCDVDNNDMKYLMTPIQKIVENLKEAKQNDKLAVLITTGGFAPIHQGHVDMMTIARKVVEDLGYRVMGGYVSPSHDQYVSTKYVDGDLRLTAAQRCHLLEVLAKDSSWLMTDGWESLMNPVAINFTEVVSRLSDYLAYHLKKNIEIFYVFGADNADFAKAFIGKGSCVCVGRQGYDEKIDQVRKDPLLIGRKNVVFADNNWISASFSSKEIRKNGAEHRIPKEIETIWTQWQQLEKPQSDVIYAVRNDLHLATAKYKKFSNFEKLIENFKTSVLNAIQAAFLDSSDVGFPKKVKIIELPTDRQLDYAKNLSKKEKTISLDVWAKGTYNLNISRKFSIVSGQLKPLDFVSRSEMMIETQKEQISPGTYTLVDDDICTGQSIKHVIESLKEKSIEINSVKSLSQWSYQDLGLEKDLEIYDIVDLRDFMVGAKHGGLMIELPNGRICRVPYLFPYVDLAARAKLPPSSCIEFSKAIWQANINFLKGLGVEVATDDGFLVFFSYLKISKIKTLRSFCEWHVAKIRNRGC